MLQTYTNAVSREVAQTPAGTPAQQASELISRYPNLSETELARLINLHAHLSALDMALMISDDQLGPKVDRFFADHRSKLRTPFRQYAVLVAIAVIGVAAIAWSLVSAG